MSEAIILENRAYWTRRAPGYSAVSREELATDQRGRWRRAIVGRIESRWPGRAPGDIRVLEIGTGPGFFAILMAEAGYRVTAIDLTPSMLEEARRNAGDLRDAIRFVEMDAEALGFTDGAFDVVLSRNVTWNLPRPERAYAEWVRVLKPGGLLLNFDANWYHYLFDAGAEAAYRRDRENSLQMRVGDLNVGENFDQMEAIARRVPLSRAQRPAWDVGVLTALGMKVTADHEVWRRVWSFKEKTNFASTPMFMVVGVK